MSKKMFLVTLAGIFAFMLGTAYLWADTVGESIERGNKMYNDPKFAENTTGMTCNSCHPGGKTTGGTVDVMGMKMKIPTLVGAAGHFPAVKTPEKKVISLAQMNNMCIMVFLKGKPLELNSQPAVDLEAYVAFFSQGRKIELKK